MIIETREQLIHVLTEAAEIEHNLLCSYLYAAFSLKRAGDPGLTPAQAEAVEGWRKTIIKVALDEMAHLATVNNLIAAVGARRISTARTCPWRRATIRRASSCA